MQGNTSSVINKSFDVQTTRYSVKTSMYNAKVKSSLNEQACDPPICTLLFFLVFLWNRVAWELNMLSCQTQIDINLFNAAHSCYLVKALKCKYLVVGLTEFLVDEIMPKRVVYANQYCIARSEYPVQQGECYN